MFDPIFSPARPTPSSMKDSVSAHWPRKGCEMSAPCPVWLSASMSSPCPCPGNGQAMSAESPRPWTVRIRVQSMSPEMSASCPRKSLPSPPTGNRPVRISPRSVHKLGRTMSALSPKRWLSQVRRLAAQCPFRGNDLSALRPIGVRTQST